MVNLCVIFVKNKFYTMSRKVTRTIGSKVTLEEYGIIAQRAGRENMSVSEFVKRQLFDEYADGGKISAEQQNMFDEKIKELTEELELMTAANEKLQNDTSNCKDNLQKLRDRNLELENENKRLNNRLLEFSEKFEHMEIYIKTLESDLEECNQKKERKPVSLYYRIDGRENFIDKLMNIKVFGDTFRSKKTFRILLDDFNPMFDYAIKVGRYFIMRLSDRIFIYGYVKYLDEITDEIIEYGKELGADVYDSNLDGIYLEDING